MYAIQSGNALLTRNQILPCPACFLVDSERQAMRTSLMSMCQRRAPKNVEVGTEVTGRAVIDLVTKYLHWYSNSLSIISVV